MAIWKPSHFLQCSAFGVPSTSHLKMCGHYHASPLSRTTCLHLPSFFPSGCPLPTSPISNKWVPRLQHFSLGFYEPFSCRGNECQSLFNSQNRECDRIKPTGSPCHTESQVKKPHHTGVTLRPLCWKRDRSK